MIRPLVKTLCVSCSAPEASVALELDDGQVEVRKNSEARSHAEFLHSSLEEMLQAHRLSLNEIDDLVIDIGPGSFTGVRIDVSFAKAFGFLKQAPVYACSSLVIYDSLIQQTDRLSLTTIDGFNGRFYFWLKSPGENAVEDFQVGSTEDLIHAVRAHPNFQENVSMAWCGNTGEQKLAAHFENHGVLAQFVPVTQTNARLMLALKNKKSIFLKKTSWKELFPLYLRASAAEEKEG